MNGASVVNGPNPAEAAGRALNVLRRGCTMKPRRKKTGDYPVGYGKPPVHTRFPRAMPKSQRTPEGQRNIKTIIREMLFAPIPIQQNGKAIDSVSNRAIVLKIRNNALAGDHRAATTAIQLAGRRRRVDEDGESDATSDRLDEEAMFEVMREFVDHNAPATRSE